VKPVVLPNRFFFRGGGLSFPASIATNRLNNPIEDRVQLNPSTLILKIFADGFRRQSFAEIFLSLALKSVGKLGALLTRWKSTQEFGCAQ
jgi:hypothetical protein